MPVNQAEVKAEIMIKDPAFVEQLKDGINQNISKGASEFTIKLAPEELGEITIKLIQEDGKSTLHIITASATASQMINDDLLALREAVKPMQIEVREAITTVEQTAESQMQHFDMSGQQFENQHHAFTKRPTFTNYSDEVSEEITEDMVENPISNVDNNNLSIYI